jgi:hypothetical protein
MNNQQITTHKDINDVIIEIIIWLIKRNIIINRYNWINMHSHYLRGQNNSLDLQEGHRAFGKDITNISRG